MIPTDMGNNPYVEIDRLKIKIAELESKLSDEWVSVEDDLPKSGRRVIFSWVNSHGKTRTSMGFYSKKQTLDADFWEETDGADYCEETGQYFCPEGWHEEMHESEYFYYVSDKVIAWMPRPNPPTEKENGS